MYEKMTAKTDTTPYKGHTGLYAAGLLLSILLLVTSAFIASKGTITGWEYPWFKKVNDLPASWQVAMSAITLMGSQWMVLIIVVGSFFARFYRLAWRLTLSVFIGLGLGILLKQLVNRARPGELFTDIQVRVFEAGMGFPSLHTTIATIVALTLLPYLPRKWRLIVPTMIVAVGVSRIYLGAHVPLDVIGGMALGTAIIATLRVLPQPLRVLMRID